MVFNSISNIKKDNKSMGCLSNFHYDIPLKKEAKRLGISERALGAAFINSKIWEKNEFTYSILNDSGRDPTCIHNAVKELMKRTDNAVKFRRLGNGNKNADITITMVSGGGNWSNLGTDSALNKPSMNIDQCQEPIVIHEFCHALGMIHEHQNPKGNPIKWNKPVVYEEYGKFGYSKQTVDINLLSVMDQSNLNGSVFDPNSIMIYDVPAKFTLDGYSVRRNLWMSDLDSLWLKKIYGSGGSSGSTGMPPGLFIDVQRDYTYLIVFVLVVIICILIFLQLKK